MVRDLNLSSHSLPLGKSPTLTPPSASYHLFCHPTHLAQHRVEDLVRDLLCVEVVGHLVKATVSGGLMRQFMHQLPS